MQLRISQAYSAGIAKPLFPRLRRMVAALAVVTFAALVGVGCGAGSSGKSGGSTTGGTSTAPSGGTTGTNLTSAQIVATITTVQAKFQSLMDAGTDIPTRDAQMVPFLKAQATVSAAGLGADGCVWARFTNNRYYMLLDNRAPLDPSKQAQSDFGRPIAHVQATRRVARAAKAMSTPSARIASTPLRRAADGMEIPQSKQARLIKALDTATFGDAVPQIQDYLQRRGYDVVVQDGTVENLRSIQNDGIFYIDTHGG